MKRVLCINVGFCIAKGINHNGGTMLEVGSIYNVTDTYEELGRSFYMLAEFGTEYAFGVRLFVELSDIDEKEFQREYSNIAVEQSTLV